MSARRYRDSESDEPVPGNSPGISFALDARGTLRTTMRGVITVADVIAYARAREAAGLLDRSQVIDATAATLNISSEDIRVLADLARSTRRREPVGRTALVASQDFAYALGRMYAGFSSPESRDFAVFRTLDEAERWLLEET